MGTSVVTMALTGGSNPTVGYGMIGTFRFVGAWAANENWLAMLTSDALSETTAIGREYLLGSYGVDSVGKMTIETATALKFPYTIADRVLVAAGQFLNISEISGISGPLGWERQNSGAGRIELGSSYGSGDTAYGLGEMLGRLAIFAEHFVQIWNVDADPERFSIITTLENTGTKFPLSIKGIGGYDLLYLDRTGVRSLRTKEGTQDAVSTDVGSPINLILQPIIAALTATEQKQVCAVVDPATKRYWVHIDGTIYVLSNFPMNGILAWSTYEPLIANTTPIAASAATYHASTGTVTYSGLVVNRAYTWTKAGTATTLVCGTDSLDASATFIAKAVTATETGTKGADVLTSLYGQSTFVPEKFVVHQGSIYARTAAGQLILYDAASFDASPMIVETPWMDMGTPQHVKTAHGVGSAHQGAFDIFAAMDPATESLEKVIDKGSASSPSAPADSTADPPANWRYSAKGSHIKIRAEQSAAERAVLSAINIKYKKANVD